jgi:hypothetical protein
MGWVDNLELAEDPQQLAVRELISNPIAAANAQINLGIYARDRARSPPLFQVHWLRPSFEYLLSGCVDHPANFQCDR